MSTVNSPKSSTKRKGKRWPPSSYHTTVYDAVADRVTTNGFQPRLELRDGDPEKFWHSKSRGSLRPDEALFRNSEGSTRTAENDVYQQDRHIAPEIKLPDSELLKAIHAYAADFYESRYPDSNTEDLRSLDETALLGMGYLIEEAATQMLGKTGDMALVEGLIPESEPNARDSINGFTYESLPSLRSSHGTQSFSGQGAKRLGFSRFTHSRPQSDQD